MSQRVGRRRHVYAAALLAALASVALGLSPSSGDRSGAAGLAGGPRAVAATTTARIPGIEVDQVLDQDPARPILIRWPVVPGHPRLAERLGTWADRRLVGFRARTRPDRAHPPEFNGGWGIEAASGTVVGVLMTLESDTRSGRVRTLTTFWSDRSAGTVATGAQLVRPRARLALARRLAPGAPDPDRVLAALTFTPAGLAALPSTDALRRPVTAEVDLTDLTPLGRAARAAQAHGAAPYAAVALAQGPAATSRLSARAAPVDCTRARCVALTYDDGPGVYTGKVLDILARTGTPATFFVIGTNVASHPTEMRRMVAEGHVVGNHTWDHWQLTHLTRAQQLREVTRTDAAVRASIGRAPALMRPPYGSWNRATRTLGVPVVMWDVDTEDWKNRDPRVTTRRAVRGARPGSIILMHDVQRSTLRATPGLIRALRARGYTLVTVPEILGPTRAGLAYYSRGDVTTRPRW